MSVLWNNLIADVRRLRGVKAAAVLAPSRRTLVESHDGGFSEALLAPVWRHVGDAAEVSAHHRLPPQEMRWIFEHVLVYCHRRADGLMLALIVGREPEAQFDVAAAGRLVEEFRKTRDA